MPFNLTTEKFVGTNQRRLTVGRLFRKVFLNDWLIKLTAIAITFAIWLGVTGLEQPLTTRLSGVTFSPLISNDLEITNSPVKEVDLVITGDKRKIDQLNPRDLVVSLDLTDVKEGERTIQITHQNIKVDLPRGVKVEKIQPDRIAIKLERVLEADVPIIAETEGTLASGFEIYSTTVTPNKVRVRGPKSFIESLSFVSTEKINLDKLDSDYATQRVPLNIVNPQISPLNIVSANVSFKIGRKRIERLFVVPYISGKRAGRVSFTLYGPDNILEKLTLNDLQVIGEKDADGTVIRLDVLLPADIKSVVTVRKAPKFRE